MGLASLKQLKHRRFHPLPKEHVSLEGGGGRLRIALRGNCEAFDAKRWRSVMGGLFLVC